MTTQDILDRLDTIQADIGFLQRLGGRVGVGYRYEIDRKRRSAKSLRRIMERTARREAVDG